MNRVQDLRLALGECLELTGTTSRDAWKPYWGTHQRFFKLLCICMKVCHKTLLTAVSPIEHRQAHVLCGSGAADQLPSSWRRSSYVCEQFLTGCIAPPPCPLSYWQAC